MAGNSIFSPVFKAFLSENLLKREKPAENNLTTNPNPTWQKNVGGPRGRSQQLAGGVACQGQTLEKVKTTCSATHSSQTSLLLMCCGKVFNRRRLPEFGTRLKLFALCYCSHIVYRLIMCVWSTFHLVLLILLRGIYRAAFWNLNGFGTTSHRWPEFFLLYLSWLIVLRLVNTHRLSFRVTMSDNGSYS